MSDFTILYTNDLHGKLTDHAMDVIRREKAASSSCLLLDAGDAVSSGNIYYRPGGEPILAKLSDLGYDAMSMGNREFHFMSSGLKSKVKLAEFPILAANLNSKSADIGHAILSYTDFDCAGLRVVVFGLCVPMITKKMFASKVSPFWFSDPIECAAAIVPVLRARADVLVAVTHIGFQKDIELAESVPGIDLIVGGHTHKVLPEPKVIGDTSIVQAGSWGHHLGKVEVSQAIEGLRIQGSLIDLREP